MTKIKFTIAALLLASTSANAATFTTGTNNGIPAIFISGEILRGDSKKFDAVTANFPQKTFVFLEGPGGLIGDGLVIAYKIRSHGFETVVDKDRDCLSICSLIWLAGSTRWASMDAMIGFHCAWKGNGECAGDGNALIGRYLGDLNLSTAAIIYITETPANGMRSLSFEDARKLGIEVKAMRSVRGAIGGRKTVMEKTDKTNVQHTNADAIFKAWYRAVKIPEDEIAALMREPAGSRGATDWPPGEPRLKCL